MTPPLPSLTIRVIVRRIFFLRSGDMAPAFSSRPSETSSRKVFPKMFVAQSFSGYYS